MTNEEILTGFMQTHYSDEKLAALLAHAEDGKLSFHSCCCFVGIPTANHALRGSLVNEELGDTSHYNELVESPDRAAVEIAYYSLAAGAWNDPERDAYFAERRDTERRAKLIPLIKAEMNRRAELRAQVEESELVTV